mgnify:CR=1 FL=1
MGEYYRVGVAILGHVRSDPHLLILQSRVVFNISSGFKFRWLRVLRSLFPNSSLFLLINILYSIRYESTTYSIENHKV